MQFITETESSKDMSAGASLFLKGGAFGRSPSLKTHPLGDFGAEYLPFKVSISTREKLFAKIQLPSFSCVDRQHQVRGFHSPARTKAVPLSLSFPFQNLII
jgi:hypothetical protein